MDDENIIQAVAICSWLALFTTFTPPGTTIATALVGRTQIAVTEFTGDRVAGVEDTRSVDIAAVSSGIRGESQTVFLLVLVGNRVTASQIMLFEVDGDIATSTCQEARSFGLSSAERVVVGLLAVCRNAYEE